MAAYRCNRCLHVWLGEPEARDRIPYACPECGCEGDFEVELEVADLADARRLFGEPPRA